MKILALPSPSTPILNVFFTKSLSIDKNAQNLDNIDGNAWRFHAVFHNHFQSQPIQTAYPTSKGVETDRERENKARKSSLNYVHHGKVCLLIRRGLVGVEGLRIDFSPGRQRRDWSYWCLRKRRWGGGGRLVLLVVVALWESRAMAPEEMPEEATLPPRPLQLIRTRLSMAGTGEEGDQAVKTRKTFGCRYLVSFRGPGRWYLTET